MNQGQSPSSFQALCCFNLFGLQTADFNRFWFLLNAFSARHHAGFYWILLISPRRCHRWSLLAWLSRAWLNFFGQKTERTRFVHTQVPITGIVTNNFFGTGEVKQASVGPTSGTGGGRRSRNSPHARVKESTKHAEFGRIVNDWCLVLHIFHVSSHSHVVSAVVLLEGLQVPCVREQLLAICSFGDDQWKEPRNGCWNFFLNILVEHL